MKGLYVQEILSAPLTTGDAKQREARMKRTGVLVGVLALAVALGMGTTAQAQPEFNLDHFKCYKAKDLKNPKFEMTTVDLSDQFGINDGKFDLKKPFLFCTPVEKTIGSEVTPITNPDDHLTCYKAKESKEVGGATKLSKETRPNVEIVNQLGTLQLQALKTFLLCVPSTKTLLP